MYAQDVNLYTFRYRLLCRVRYWDDCNGPGVLRDAIASSCSLGIEYHDQQINWRIHHGLNGAVRIINAPNESIQDCVTTQNVLDAVVPVLHHISRTSMIRVSGVPLRFRPITTVRAFKAVQTVIAHPSRALHCHQQLRFVSRYSCRLQTASSLRGLFTWKSNTLSVLVTRRAIASEHSDKSNHTSLAKFAPSRRDIGTKARVQSKMAVQLPKLAGVEKLSTSVVRVMGGNPNKVSAHPN